MFARLRLRRGQVSTDRRTRRGGRAPRILDTSRPTVLAYFLRTRTVLYYVKLMVKKADTLKIK